MMHSQFALKQLYLETFGDSGFQTMLILGFVVFWCVKRIGYFIYNNYANTKIPSIEFVGYLMSLVHSLMISITSIFVLFNYNGDNSMYASSNDIIINTYKISSIFSVSYFFMDIMDLLLFYSHRGITYKLSFIIHHTLCSLCQCTVYKSHPYVTYFSSLHSIIEISTVFLDIRMFGKMFQNVLSFKIGGIGTLVTYPLQRIVFNVYLLYMTFYSKIDYYLCFECKYILWICEVFVFALSGQYFFLVMLKKPKSMYVLTPQKKLN